MKLNTSPRLSTPDQALNRELVSHALLVNLLTDGRAAGTNNATSSIPTTGTYAVGDFVKNSAPSELGSVGSKYVIAGWMCVAAGSPGTLVQCRFLTGN